MVYTWVNLESLSMIVGNFISVILTLIILFFIIKF